MTANTSAEALIARCSAIGDGTGQGVDWVAATRKDSPRLDRDAAALTERLRRGKVLARRLKGAAARPMAVGFFGLSQAGKSYLISALARSAAGSLETVMDGQRLNFIAHINPPGGGKEATGIVTRFTRQSRTTVAGFPVRLDLLSEPDLLKIIGNSFFMDFDHQKAMLAPKAEEMQATLTDLARRLLPSPTPGMEPEDVVDVMDYFLRRFPIPMQAYQGSFWPKAMELAPRLAPADRATLFGLLWGNIPELTAVYLRLRDALHAVSHAATVLAELGALVRPDGGGLSQADSIMNVDMLSRLGRDDADQVRLVPLTADGTPGPAVTLARSLLATLSREMTFELADPPMAPMLEQVDLLDFPGYRGRLKVTNLQEVAEKLEGRDPVAELILRGKVAYLFERYTDDQEMNVLVMCTPCHKQSDVNDLGPALESWINSTQGATPEERARRRAGLVWAITMFDQRLAPRPDETLDLIRSSWHGMMRLTLREKFEQFDWLDKWAPGQSFNNLFLVRKPGMAAGVIATDDRGRETEIVANQQVRMGQMRDTFVADDSVNRHFSDPAAAWDGMMAMDDGGMGRLTAYLEQVARRELKLERINEQVTHLQASLTDSSLGSYYRADGADAVAQKQQVAQAVSAAVAARIGLFAELLTLLHLPSRTIRDLYTKAEAEADAPPASSPTAKDAAPAAPAFDGGGASFLSLDLSGFGQEAVIAPPPETATVSGSRASRFAEAVISGWLRHLRSMPEDPTLHRYLGLDEATLQAITDELVTGALRLRLEERLSERLSEAEDRAGATRSDLLGRQVAVVSTMLNGFVDMLGQDVLPLDRRPASSRLAGRKLFQPPPPLIGNGQGQTLPTLDERPLNYSAVYILDWLDAFTSLATGNAGHAAGSELTPEQNQRLGQILELIRHHAA